MTLVTELTSRRLRAHLVAAQRAGKLPSVAAALTRDRVLVWRGSVGEETGMPGVRPAELQYRIGSITKTMTAVLVMQLRDEGLISLDDPLEAHVPIPRFGEVTVRALLSHTAGLPAEPEGSWWERSEGVSLGELVSALRGATAPFEPGHVHHYSNLGYALLGAMVAQVRDAPWWECLSTSVLSPLGMLRTSYDGFEPHAQGYSVHPFLNTLTPEPATDTAAMAPAGQVWSTVLDLATFADFLITGHPDVLRGDTLREMTIPQVGNVGDAPRSGYGLGLRLLRGGSGVLAGHTGSMPGHQASMFVDRERRTGAVVLANSTTGLASERIAPELLDVLEEHEPSVPDIWLPAEQPPAAVAEICGVWHWGNTAHVLTWDGVLVHSALLATGERRDSYRLEGDSFVGVWGYHQGERLDVVRAEDGSVRHLEATTFVYTRTPYDPDAPIPGGPPRLRGPG